MKRLIYILILLLLTAKLQAQFNIKGVIRDAKTKETLVGANVYLENTTHGSTTDLDGNYEIKNVPKGKYVLIVSFISYKAFRKEISVSQNIALNIELEEEVTTIKAVEVVETRKTDTDVSMISSIRNSSIVANGISNQQIARSQDRDAAEAVKRIPGITIIDNRFIIVRGLSERYNTVWFNNLATPSAESDSRAFSFDMLPTSSIDRMMVYKTPAPELPGDFSGGAVQIFSKGMPDKNAISVSYSSSFHPTTTGREFYKFPIGKYDWLVLNDGSRNLPADFPQHLNQLSNKPSGRDSLKMWGRKIYKKWSSDTMVAPIDHRFSLGTAFRIKAGSFAVGNITQVSYSNTYKISPFDRNGYQYFDTIQEKSDTLYTYRDRQFSNTARVSLMHNWIFTYGKNHKLEILNQFNFIGNNRTTVREGIDENVREIRAFEYRLMNRYIYSGQLAGSHKFFDENTTLTWAGGYSEIERDDPGQKRLTTIRNDNKEDSLYYNKYYANFSFAADPRQAGCIYLNMKEKIYSANANVEQKLSIGSWLPSVNFGFYGEKREREFKIRNIGFAKAKTSKFKKSIGYLPFDSIFADTNINNVTGLKVSEMTKPSDSYTASNHLYAGYIGLKIPIGTRINIYSGVRYEWSNIKLNSFSTDNAKDSVNVNDLSIDYFPSINSTFNFDEKSLIRLAYGMTTNRPEFREFAPLNYFDFDAYTSVVGNDSLVNAYIHNFDMRFEHYPDFGELFSFGVFCKLFEKPIESIMYNAGTGFNYSFANADKAISYGSEIELKKMFTKLGKKNNFLRNFRDFGITANAAYIFSKVIIENVSDYYGSKERQMQGQSPYIVNAGLLYSNDSLKFEVTLLYNIIGKRIVVVGDRTNPDIYEMPRNQLDLTISKKFGKHIQIKGGIQDILNEPYIYRQFVKYTTATSPEEKSAIQDTWNYKPGSYYTLGFTVMF